jgi:predicted nucleic acid-binding protein
MILFDTSVIIDARDPDSPWHSWAKEQIADAVGGDGAGVNAVVVSEASVRATDPDAVPGSLEAFGMTLLSLPGSIWTGSRKKASKTSGKCRFLTF